MVGLTVRLHIKGTSMVNKICDDCDYIDPKSLSFRPCPKCGSKRYTIDNDEHKSERNNDYESKYEQDLGIEVDEEIPYEVKRYLS